MKDLRDRNISIGIHDRFRIDTGGLALVVAFCSEPLAYFGGISGYPVILAVVRAVQILAYMIAVVNICRNHNLGRLLGIMAAIGLVLGGTWMVYSFNRPALEEIWMDTLFQSFFFIIAFSCNKPNECVKTARVFSYITIALYAFVLVTRNDPYSPDRILVSNAMIFAGFFLLGGNSKKKVLDKILGIVAFVLMLMFGRRAHILYLAIMLVFDRIHKAMTSEKKGKIIWLSVLIFVIGFMSMYIDTIIIAVASALESLGIQGRTITMMISGEFMNLNGRDPLYEDAWRMALEKPLIGHGIGSTMVRNFDILWNPVNYSGCNTHNGILEFAAEFGFIGLAVFLVLHIMILKKLLHMRLDENEWLIMMYLFTTGLVAMLVGSSYLTNANYAMFLGFFMNCTRKVKLKHA